MGGCCSEHPFRRPVSAIGIGIIPLGFSNAPNGRGGDRACHAKNLSKTAIDKLSLLDLDQSGIRLQIDLRLCLDEVAEADAAELRATPKKPPSKGELCQLACRIYDARRTRN